MAGRRDRQLKVLTHRQRRVRYFLGRTAWVVAIAGVLAAGAWADRAGMFGRAPRGDWATYHGRQFKVVRVIDGDTLDVDHPDGTCDTTRIRLWGVDTPETVKPNTPVQHFGPEATDFARQAAGGKTVTLRLCRLRPRGMHGRLLAYVILPGGMSLNEAIIATGHGYADPRSQFSHPRQARYKQLQREAMAAGLGLWKDVTDADLPYYYRGKLKLPAQVEPLSPESFGEAFREALEAFPSSGLRLPYDPLTPPPTVEGLTWSDDFFKVSPYTTQATQTTTPAD